MKFEHVNIFTSEHGFKNGSISFEETIQTIELTGDEDPKSPYCIPGLIDIHTHGNSGEDFSDASPEGLKKMGQYYASHGITSFAGTTVTLPVPQLIKACQNGVSYMKSNWPFSAHLKGIHLEGPHFSFKKRGAQNPEYLMLPDLQSLSRLSKASEGLLRITDIAPELEGSMEYIRSASRYCRVSVAHTEADYRTASEAYASGATLLTHSFNAMPAILGREPGPIIAALEHENVFAELIGDGKHIAPANVRLMFRLFGADRIVLISDSLRCCGMPAGSYTLGGQDITVRDGLGYLSDGTIAGAANNLFDNLKAVVSFGIRREDAIQAAAQNPARVLGCDSCTGSIAPGKDADLLLYRNDFDLQEVYVAGKKVC